MEHGPRRSDDESDVQDRTETVSKQVEKISSPRLTHDLAHDLSHGRPNRISQRAYY